jgi:hypothetical protein
MLMPKERIEPKKGFQPYKAPEIKLAAPTYSWCDIAGPWLKPDSWLFCFRRESESAQQRKNSILPTSNLRRVPLSLTGETTSRCRMNSDDIVRAAASETNVTLHPIFTGMSSKGGDLGSIRSD